MIQPFLTPQAPSPIAAPASAAALDPAGSAMAVLNAAETGQAPTDFVTIMAKIPPLESGVMADSDLPPETASPEIDAAVTDSMPGSSPPHRPDHAPAQWGAMAPGNDGPAGLTAPEPSSSALAALAPPAGATVPVPSPESTQTSHNASIAAQPRPTVSLAAMAFADRSAAAHPSPEWANLPPVAADPPTDFSDRGPMAVPAARQDIVKSGSNGRPPDISEQSVAQTPATDAGHPMPKRAEPSLSSPDWPAQTAAISSENLSNNAESATVGQKQTNTNRTQAEPPPAPLPAQTGPLPAAPLVPPPVPVAGPAGLDARASTDSPPSPAPFVLHGQPALRPGTDTQLAPPRAAHAPAAGYAASDAPPAGRDILAAPAAAPAAEPHFVTNIAETRILQPGHDPASPGLIAFAAEPGPRPPEDDPVPTRPPATPLLPTAEILRLVQTTPTGPVTLTLRPEELGTLRFEVTQTDHGLHIHLSVEQPHTLDLLRRQGDQLLADLRQAGFADASLSFADGGAQDAPPQQRDQAQDTPHAPATLPAPAHLLPPPRLAAPPGTLDLRL